MSTRTDSLVSVSIIAGEIRPSAHPAGDKVGKQIAMGDNLYMHITPETARQWIGVLAEIAGDSIPE